MAGSRFKRASRRAAKLRMALVGPPGSGKAQPVDRLVLTPSGWVRIGELRPGDVVVDPDGGSARVTAVYPQGEKDVFLVSFSDGSETECCDEHLWWTTTTEDRAARRPGSVRSLAAIRETLVYTGKRNHAIPMVGRVDLGDGASLPLDPYVLGVLLGDGGMTSDAVTLNNPEGELINRIAALLPSGVELRMRNTVTWGVCRQAASGENPVAGILDDLGLRFHKSIEKFIPALYKWASFDARLALLQGLLDTDGYAHGSTLEYTSSSPALAHDVLDLVRSLGGKASLSSRIPTYTYKGERREGARSYRMNISLPGDVAPFRLTRKAAAYTPRTKYQPTRYIDAVEPAGRKECVCIAVDTKRSLYVTDDFIVTHNTYTALRVATALADGERVGLVDTEHESGLLYSPSTGQPADPARGTFEFDHLPLERYGFDDYIDAITAAKDEGIRWLVIDSISHAWSGKGGALEQVDRIAKSTGNKFTAWGDVTPGQNRFVEAMLGCGMDLIVTMRTKIEYVLEDNERGKKAPRKVGTVPIQRDGVEYEFGVVLDMQQGGDATVSKTRCSALQGASFLRPGADLAAILRTWLDGGADPAAVAAEVARTTSGRELLRWADSVNVLQGADRAPALDAFRRRWSETVAGAPNAATLDAMCAAVAGLPAPLRAETEASLAADVARRRTELAAAGGAATGQN